MFELLVPLAFATSPVATLALPSPCASAKAPPAKLLLPSPVAFALSPVAMLKLGFAAVPPLALAVLPVAMFALGLELVPPLALAPCPKAEFALAPVLLALALVPQATLLTLPAAVAPAPLAVAGGTVAPVALPTQTNCARAGGAPRQHAAAIASADVEQTKDNRMRFMTSPPVAKIVCKMGSTASIAAEYGTIRFR